MNKKIIKMQKRLLANSGRINANRSRSDGRRIGQWRVVVANQEIIDPSHKIEMVVRHLLVSYTVLDGEFFRQLPVGVLLRWVN